MIARPNYLSSILAGIFVVLTALVLPKTAAAQADSQRTLAATALYEQALKELHANQYDSACPKLEEVTRLEPQGLGARLTLANCYEALGKLASAWSQYALVEAMASKMGQPERAEKAAQKAAELKPRLAMLTVQVAKEAVPIVGLSITRDGVLVGQAQWGVPLPADAGRHEITAAAPGRRTWKTTVQVGAAAATVQVTVPALSAETTASAAPQGRPVQRIAGITVGSLGLAALAVGAGFAIAAATKNDASLKYCLPDDPNKCYPKGVVLRNESIQFADTSTVVMSIGGVALATGVALFLTAPSPRPPARQARMWVLPDLSAHAAGVHLGVAW